MFIITYAPDGDWDTVYENMLTLSTVPNIDLAAGTSVQAHNIFIRVL